MSGIVETVAAVFSSTVPCFFAGIGCYANHAYKKAELKRKLQEAIEHADTIKKYFKSVNRRNTDDIMKMYINLVSTKNGQPIQHEIYVAKQRINSFLEEFVNNINETETCNGCCALVSLNNKFISTKLLAEIEKNIIYLSRVVEPLNWIWHQIDYFKETNNNNTMDSIYIIQRDEYHKYIQKYFINGQKTLSSFFYEEFLQNVLNYNNEYKYVLAKVNPSNTNTNIDTEDDEIKEQLLNLFKWRR